MDHLSTGVSKFDNHAVGQAAILPSVLKLTEYHKFDYETEYCLGNGDSYKQTELGGIDTISKPLTCMFLSRLQFLTCYWNGLDEHPNPIFLFIPLVATQLENYTPDIKGLKDATNFDMENIFLLSQLFPMIKFHIYNTQELNSKYTQYFVNEYNVNSITDDNNNFVIHRKMFNLQEAELWNFGNVLTPTQKTTRQKINLFVVTDYSTELKQNINERYFNEITDDDVNDLHWSYMQYQKELLLKINPTKCMLKFCLPTPTSKTLSISENRSYFEGTLYKKAWDLRYAKDLNLVPNYGLREKEWNVKIYSMLIKNHNVEKRGRTKFYNVINNSRTSINSKLQLENDFDSCLTVSIIGEYLRKFGYSDDTPYIFTLLSSVLKSFNETHSSFKSKK